METVYQDDRVGTTYAKIYERIAYKFSSTKISTERAGTKKMRHILEAKSGDKLKKS